MNVDVETQISAYAAWLENHAGVSMRKSTAIAPSGAWAGDDPTDVELHTRPRSPRGPRAMFVSVAAVLVVAVGGLIVVGAWRNPPSDVVTDEPATSTRTPTVEPGVDRYPVYQSVDEVLDDIDQVEEAITLDRDGNTRFDTAYFDCMSNAGFAIPPAVRPNRTDPSNSPPRAWTRELRAATAFERASLAEVSALGYDAGRDTAELDETDQSDTEPVAMDPLSQWIGGLSPERQEAYAVADLGHPNGPMVEYTTDGVVTAALPAEGCNYVALQAAHVDAQTWFNTLSELNTVWGLVGISAHSSDSYRAAVEAWTACVASSGHQLDSPDLLEGSIEQAVADRTCRDDVGLRQVRIEAVLERANLVRERIGQLVDDARALSELQQTN